MMKLLVSDRGVAVNKNEQPRSGLDFDLRQESVEPLLNQLIQGRFFGAPPLVADGIANPRPLSRLAHDRLVFLLFLAQ
jgi:hypothetical protein